MSYQQPYSVPNPVVPGGPAKRGMSGGMIAAIVVASLVMVCVAPVVFCWTSGVFEAVLGPQPDPTVEITSCQISDVGSTGRAEIEYTVRNNGLLKESYLVSFEVTTDTGDRVGSGVDISALIDTDEIYTGQTRVILTAAGGTNCAITDVS